MDQRQQEIQEETDLLGSIWVKETSSAVLKSVLSYLEGGDKNLCVSAFRHGK